MTTQPPHPQVEKRLRGYDPHLDSLRAVSALAIIPFHWGLLAPGWIGVQVFFVLSGLVITESLIKSKTRIPELRHFIVYFFEKRILRLFPLYYGFLALMALWFLFTGYNPQFPLQAPYLFTYSFNLHNMASPALDQHAPYVHLWSLGVEWQFYLLWPFAVWFLNERWLVRFSVFLLFLAPLLRAITYFYCRAYPIDIWCIGSICYNAPWSHIDAFAIGALLVHERVQRIFAAPSFWAPVGIVTAVFGAMVIYFSHGVVRWDSFGYVLYLVPFYQPIWGYSLLDPLAGSLITLTILRSPLTAFANWKWLQHLGKISYGIYVFHYPLVLAARWIVGTPHTFTAKGVAMLPVIVLADIILAELSYRFFESWFLRKKAELR